MTRSPSPQLRRARRAPAAAVLAAAVLAGCGAREAEVAAQRWPYCPAQLDPRLAPRGVRVINESADSVTVWVERCAGHRRLGDLRPREVRIFPMPERVVAYEGGIRIHAFRNGTMDGYAAMLLPVDSARVARLVIPATPPSECKPEIYVDGVRAEGKPDIPREKIERVDLLIGPGVDATCLPYNIITRKDG